jgi:serine/threonine protein kinase
MGLADELTKLANLLEQGLITRDEYEDEKRALRMDRNTTSFPSVQSHVSNPKIKNNSIGAYQIKGTIGEGGMGIVYRARHRTEAVAIQQGGDVALKVLHTQYSNNATYQARFEREASVSITLQHPNIVKSFDFVVDGGSLGLAMERLDGVNLSEVIEKQRGPIPWREALEMFDQVLSAVCYAHSKGVVHRDLKPENIMINGSGVLKILDFGIAKVEEGGGTQTGTGLGTIHYMAPEQYTDASTVDQRADVYALGVTLYEMLAGRLPWPRETSEFLIMTLKVNEKLPLPSDFYPDIPPSIVQTIMSALNADLTKRTATASLLKEALATEWANLDPVLDVSVKETDVIDQTIEDDGGIEDHALKRVADPPVRADSPGDGHISKPKSERSILIVVGIGAVLVAAALLSGFWLPWTSNSSAEMRRSSLFAAPVIEVESPDSGEAMMRYVRATSLSIRIAPHANADRLSTIPFGTPVRTRRVVDSEWYQLLDFRGFVHGEYLANSPSQETKYLTLMFNKDYPDTKHYQHYTLNLQRGKAELLAVTRDTNGVSRHSQQGTYNITGTGLTVNLSGSSSSGTHTREQSLSLSYNPELRGFVTPEIIEQSASAYAFNKSKHLWRSRYYCASLTGICDMTMTYWYQSNRAYYKEQSELEKNRMWLREALLKQQPTGGQYATKGKLWRTIGVGSTRQETYSLIGNPTKMSKSGQTQWFRVGDKDDVPSKGSIQVFFEDDRIAGFEMIP